MTNQSRAWLPCGQRDWICFLCTILFRPIAYYMCPTLDIVFNVISNFM